MSDRVDIIGIITENPGIKFSEIMRKTGLKNGVLSYKLRKLEESGSMQTERTPGATRYYPLGMGVEETIVAKHLRQNIFRNIMVLLYENPKLSFQNIVQMSKFSSSGVSIALNKLVSVGIINVEFEKRKKLYDIDKKNIMKKMINEYNHDILGGMVSRHQSSLTTLLLVVISLSQKFLFDQPVDLDIFGRLSLF